MLAAWLAAGVVGCHCQCMKPSKACESMCECMLHIIPKKKKKNNSSKSKAKLVKLVMWSQISWYMLTCTCMSWCMCTRTFGRHMIECMIVGCHIILLLCSTTTRMYYVQSGTSSETLLGQDLSVLNGDKLQTTFSEESLHNLPITQPGSQSKDYNISVHSLA